jgi:hypothetical protein
VSALEQGATDERLDDEATQIAAALEQIGAGKYVSRALLTGLCQMLQVTGSDLQLLAAELRSGGLAA